MKKNLIRALLVAMMVCLAFTLASCSFLENLPFDIPFLNSGKDENPYGDLEGYVLIYEGKATFNVVYTAASEGEGKKAAESFVKTLRKLGIEVNDAISDEDPSLVTDRELIIGPNAQHRGDDANVFDKYLGEKGYTYKVVGERLVVAGGTPKLTKEKFEWFTKYTLGITDKTKSLEQLAVQPEEIFKEQLTSYMVESVKIDSVDIKDFTIVTDLDTAFTYSNIVNFRNNLYERSGYWLNTGNIKDKDSYEHCIVIRKCDRKTDANGNYLAYEEDPGFYVYVEDGDLVIECAYANSFNTAFQKFMNSAILTKKGNVSIAKSFTYEDFVSIVKYEDFGANGNDDKCDYKAIYNAHSHANEGGQKVMGEAGANYIISAEGLTYVIPVQTDTDFNGATFTIDDKGIHTAKNSLGETIRNIGIFHIKRDYDPIIIDNAAEDERFKDVTIPFGTTKFEWLVGILEAKSLVRIYNSEHKDFKRWGANEDKGQDRQDIFIVDVDGTVAEDTPVAYDFDKITKIQICRVDDKPITITNGTFENKCCVTTAATNYMGRYQQYKRGFVIKRSEVTISNIVHRMIEEPTLGDSMDPAYDQNSTLNSTLHPGYGSRRESYPYYGFFYIYDSHNVLAKDSILTGHTTYYEDKAATASTGGEVPNPVAMGSYDLIIEYSSNVTLKDVVQRQGADSLEVTRINTETFKDVAGKNYEDYGLGDQKHWGIMSSNGSKNMNFYNCEINRFDAHRGFWNATLIDTIIGHSFNVVGGGYLYAENVTMITGASFIYSRGDYGAPFRGDVYLKNCYAAAVVDYKTNRPSGGTEFDPENLNSRVEIYDAGFSTSNGGWIASKPSTEEDQPGAAWLWNFGYECGIPYNFKIENFRSGALQNTYVYNELINTIFIKNYDPNNISSSTVKYPYRITETITLIYDTALYSDIYASSGEGNNFSMINNIDTNIIVKREGFEDMVIQKQHNVDLQVPKIATELRALYGEQAD